MYLQRLMFVFQLQQLQQLGVTQSQEHAGALTLTLQHHTVSPIVEYYTNHVVPMSGI